MKKIMLSTILSTIMIAATFTTSYADTSNKDTEADNYRFFDITTEDDEDLGISEYVTVFYNDDDEITTILQEVHFDKEEGYSAELISENLDPDSFYDGFSTALFTTLEIEDNEDEVIYLMWFEKLDNILYLKSAEKMGIIIFEEQGLYSSASASSYCSSLIDEGYTEIKSSRLKKTLGLHTEHAKDPYYNSKDDLSNILEKPATRDLSQNS